jgi:hypothetical protein
LSINQRYEKYQAEVVANGIEGRKHLVTLSLVKAIDSVAHDMQVAVAEMRKQYEQYGQFRPTSNTLIAALYTSATMGKMSLGNIVGDMLSIAQSELDILEAEKDDVIQPGAPMEVTRKVKAEFKKDFTVPKMQRIQEEEQEFLTQNPLHKKLAELPVGAKLVDHFTPDEIEIIVGRTYGPDKVPSEPTTEEDEKSSEEDNF